MKILIYYELMQEAFSFWLSNLLNNENVGIKINKERILIKEMRAQALDKKWESKRALCFGYL